MEIRYSITLHLAVISKDIPRLDTFWRHTIRDAIREKLKTKPELYGKPLRQTLKSCRTLRIGDYRVVFKIQDITVYIVGIVHRRAKYEGIEKRI
ncbi:hypothetical protein A2852_00510 [Candidatus Adlerbacteria bacterium RIFCSPHIGHO2_01_FULL_54_23]|uniref:Addiction module antitoxin RelB n=3 Tax=Candidatus Adleribacteriota TaxID=1752736 RepID=A0A1F4Y0C6_9BACT|nr:MAG: Toxin-antitoxin system, toxin component, RelE family [Candidatus Adlerbacteria bacterium GW2011_GWA1_54_10]KKW36353.1 MAG: Toxin-antitoxin system, toxin component, RelE family [Candidatus Adlerbacteria bacterium GW2011_GWA2_54_12]KKW37505.1 MAG: Toxin-antitoxin system, toxin component, RelE family [Candidatus Adlerbacteria bacterium GW2011_GWB1_54_7]OGC79308.1 MAG: hypothetical protein A2852_00510 [Candidatus Adlerbacteria bacterium RIFCSPHIGHO2_01_FULL_54_23]OGC87334.1 MAG: hypothetica